MKVHSFIIFLKNDRTVMAIVFAAALIFFMGMLRPNKDLGIYEKQFWATKIGWRNCADLVITGDSRVLGGVSPSILKKSLGNFRIVNYAFVGNRYVPEYLEIVKNVLNTQSDQKMIILGITPASLTEGPDNESHFYDLSRLTKRERFMDIYISPLLSFFDYMSFHDAEIGLCPSRAHAHTQKEYFADGWVAFTRELPGKKKEIKRYLRTYESKQVDSKFVDNLIRFVSRWKKSGIKVYGFLVPTCQQMAELEKNFSGFHESEFKESFRNAGGIWIDIDGRKYDSYDGSHLLREFAEILSRELASKILEKEQFTADSAFVDFAKSSGR